MSWIAVKLLDQPETFKLEQPLWLQRANKRIGHVLVVLYGILNTVAWLCMSWVVYMACESLQLDIKVLVFGLLLVLVTKIIH